jgi:hypothetical protein
MTPIPRVYLRFIERDEIIGQDPQKKCFVAKQVKVLQQFWAHPGGKDYSGDLFNLESGTWCDIPTVKEKDTV